MARIPLVVVVVVAAALLLASLVVAADDARSVGPTTVEVSTTYGTLRGTTDGRVSTFLGVPFAAPPVGNLRWAPPVPPSSFTGVRDCFKEAPACMQKPNRLFSLPGISEDCLYLNIYAPTSSNASNLPVMVWVHGGSFGYGTASENKYNATLLVEAENVVVVTINYRLGLFGFLAEEAFLSENANFPSTGMYGMLDQQIALKWVQQNIAAFSGDPNSVTLFGESAGGMSVCLQLGIPSSGGLFQRAIIESGPCNGYKPLQMALQDGANFTQIMGCANMSPSQTRDCLRGKPAADVLVHQLQFPQIGPIVDGFVLPKEPINMLRDGNWNKVPLLIGSNKDEGGLFVDVMFSPNITNDEYYDIIESYIGPVLTPVVYAMYPPIAYGGSAGKALGALIGDMVFTCPTQNAAVAASQSSDTYCYLFSHTPSWVPQSAGAYHGSEIPFVFGHSIAAPFTNKEEQLSDRMQAYWGSFARSGSPNVPAQQTVWPLYEEETRPRIVFDTTNQLKTNTKYRAKECNFWNTVYSIAGSVINNNGGINAFIKQLTDAQAAFASEQFRL